MVADQKILITGAAGFIGKTLIKTLEAMETFDIHAVSRQVRLSRSNTKWIKGDLRDTQFCRTLGELQFDKVVHLAWEGLPHRTFENSCINSFVTIGLLNLFSDRKDTEITLIGSCLEFGDDEGLVEDSKIPSGYDHFAQSKIQIHNFASLRGLNYKWVRPFYLYGYGQSSKSLIPALINSYQQGEEPQIRQPESAHDFINIEDFAMALTLIINSATDKRIFNVGTGVLTNVGQIANEIAKIFGKSPPFGDFQNIGLRANAESVRLLGWNPRYVGISGIRGWLRESVEV